MDDGVEVTILDNDNNEVSLTLEVSYNYSLEKPDFVILSATRNGNSVDLGAIMDGFDSVAELHNSINEELDLYR